MEMQQVRYFLALSRTLNFRRAAEECNVSQPALTRAIQGLEAEFGGELIRRERRLTHLTELGRRMLPPMQQCYDAAMSAQRLAHAVKSNDAAPLSIALARSINVELIVGPLTQLFGAYPGVRLKIRRGTGVEILEMLKKGEVELVVGVDTDASWDRLDRWPLFDEPFVVVIHQQHPLGRHNMLHVRNLVGEQLLFRSQCELAEPLASELASKGLTSDNRHEVEADHDLIALIEANAGAGLLPASAPRSDRLRHQAIDDLTLRRTIAIYAAAGRQRSPVGATLLNLLRVHDWPESDLPE